MNIIVRNPNGVGPHRALSKEQFAAIHDDLVAAMNKRGVLTDTFVIAKLEALGMPIDFTPTPADVVLEIALYADPPLRRLFLSGWVGRQDRYDMVRSYLTNEELDLFDMKVDEVDQRTFLALIAMVEGADRCW